MAFKRNIKMIKITDKIIAIIPARCNSKSIKDKNIQSLGKQPLIAWSIQAGLSAPEIDRVIVSTDSVVYQFIAQQYKAEVPFLRPENISGDNNTDVEWVVHLLDWLADHENELPKYLIHLRPTSPLRDIKYISQAIECIKQHPRATALRSVVQMQQSVYKHFEIENSYLKLIGSDSFDLDLANKPRQFYPATYDANGYVDILKTEFILDSGKKKIHGDKVLAFPVPYITDIDSMKDLEFARWEIEHV